MRMFLVTLVLGVTVAAVALPALAEPDDHKTDLGTIDQFLAQSDRDTPQISVGVVAGSEELEPQPVVQDMRYDNYDSQEGAR